MVDLQIIDTDNGHFHRCKYLIDNAELNQPVLDIGCADGFMFRDTCIDVVETDIKYEFPACYRDKIKFVQADAQSIPFENNQFECSILGDMLEHVVNPLKVIQEAARVSKKVFISVPNEWEWTADKRPFQHADHIRFYTKHKLIKDIELAIGLNRINNLYKINGGGWSFYCVEIC